MGGHRAGQFRSKAAAGSRPSRHTHGQVDRWSGGNSVSRGLAHLFPLFAHLGELGGESLVGQ